MATLIYGPKLERFAVGIAGLEATPATPVTVDGATYAYADLPTLYRIRDWLAVKAAMEKIELSAQSESIDGRAASRAQYDQLAKRERELAGQLPETFPGAVRTGGIRVRHGVPV